MTELKLKATKDQATVTTGGQRLEQLIDGVVLRRAVAHEDERGSMCEVLSDAWGFDPTPIRYVYTVQVRPGRVKGWVYHKLQSDRVFVVTGFIKHVLWDSRPDSPTHGLINEIFISERNRGLLLVPPYVVHAVQNIGHTDATFINMPTVPYNHADPDKYRVDPASVPYSFDKGLGW